ncbi:alpha-tocopherol transfer protein-like [Anneissia japonica]|uniref:alpha-tocopherol transfer protein-like n=1 Tax=Anneissia japonica TaxID=1529436 RepID=UPI0014254C2B|nr:alpha-tocopherol transfer protein-like [Anneissia japonica]
MKDLSLPTEVEEMANINTPYKWTLGRELAAKAEKELGETPRVREAALAKIKSRMKERSDINFRRDDRFILRFLRAKKFEVDRSFKTLVKYYELKEKHPDFFKDYKPSSIAHVLDDGFPVVLDLPDNDGRPILALKVSKWNASEYNIIDIAKAVFMAMEMLIESEKNQINGVVLLADLEGIGLSHAMQLTPGFARKVTAIFQNCVPVRLQGIHFVNEPLVFSGVYHILKPFMQDKIRKRVQVHGRTYSSLHQYLPADALPSDYEGKTGPYTNEGWRARFLALDPVFEENFSFGIQKKSKGSKKKGTEKHAKEIKEKEVKTSTDKDDHKRKTHTL